MTANRPANRLARETSPYLRQHAHNPVDWYPWGEEALKRARDEGLPIFLSIGYSACHWCHVMERESFENEAIAAIMNERFVNIKVDREERPDLDDIYMTATQLLAGQGGWPNSVFLTPDCKPFFAGTYFPPDARHGRPGFGDVLTGIADAFRNKRDDVARVSEEVAGRIRQMSELSASKVEIGPALLSRAFGDLAGRFDGAEGGFGGAPKFPHSMDLSFLLRFHRRTGNPEALRMAVISLDRMARGGLNDQLGGGFHRYTVDGRWLIPHFEKMLYDNALLARTYVEASQAVAGLQVSHALPDGGEATAAGFRTVARETLDWVLRNMTSAEGGFYSSLDADSDGEEGKYYVWSLQELQESVGREEAGLVAAIYGVTTEGNFEAGRSVLHLPKPVLEVARDLRSDETDLRLRLAAARSRLLQARERRVRPGLDDKILADWNGLTISALAVAGRLLGETRYTAAACRAARMILDRMRPGGRLMHSYRAGDARHPAYLTDYASLIAAFLDLYEASFDHAWIGEARGLAAVMIEMFLDRERGGFFLTAVDHEPLIARRRETSDGATPAGASIAALALPRLAALTGDSELEKHAASVLRLYRDQMERFPAAFGAMLCAADQAIEGTRQVVLAGAAGAAGLRPLLETVRTTYLPNTVVALADPSVAGQVEAIPLLQGKTPPGGQAAAYVCERGTCKAPVTSADDLRALLAS
jgi:hypothetical protein